MVSPLEIVEIASKSKDLYDLLRLRDTDLTAIYVRAFDDMLKDVASRQKVHLPFNTANFEELLRQSAINLYQQSIHAEALTAEIGDQVCDLLLDDQVLPGVEPGTLSAMTIVRSAHRQYEQRAFTDSFPEAVRIGLRDTVRLQQTVAAQHRESMETGTERHREVMAALRELLERGTASPPPPPPDEIEWTEGSPYPGLDPFTAWQAPVYFGRDREIEELLAWLRDPPSHFLAVVGASGTGKSSLVAAGLLPRLAAGAVPGSQDWVVVAFRPDELGSGNPFAALVHGIKVAGIPFDRQGLAARLRDQPTLLDEIAAEREILLVIDQFEELFTLVEVKHRQPFINLIAYAETVPSLRTVVTLRGDFYGHCGQHSQLARLLTAGNYLLATPGIGALYQMITGPAARAGLRFDPADLPDRIVWATVGAPGGLPLMAHALRELYIRSEDETLTADAYDDLGGVGGAIGKIADETFNELERPVQDALPRVFLKLVQVGEGDELTRRRVALAAIVEDDPPALQLVAALTETRLLTQGRGDDDRAVVEVAHEALFSAWEHLAAWIAEIRGDLRERGRVELAAQDWEEQGRDERYLWPDRRLELARRMIEQLGLDLDTDFSPTERAFLLFEAERFWEGVKDELADPDTPHARRREIGVQLSSLSDRQPGVGVKQVGDKLLPDIAWCQVGEDEAGYIDVEIESIGAWRVATPFSIARYPITCRQFRAFLDDEIDGFYVDDWWEDVPAKYRQQEIREQEYNYDNHPRVGVSWFGAMAFCRWLSAQLGYHVTLPTEVSWQAAATLGDPGLEYPWPGGWDARYANTGESGLGHIIAVGMYPHGAAPCGALDMAGNVWEWCLPAWGSGPDKAESNRRVLRGGSWHGDRNGARAASRGWSGPQSRSRQLGFRVVASPVSSRSDR